MKKIILSILALVCAAACMLALISCGDKTPEEITPTDQTPNSGSTLTENTDFSAIVSDQLSAQEWVAAFSDASLANSTIKHTNTYYNRVAYRYAEINGTSVKIYVPSTQQTQQNERQTSDSWFTIADGIAYMFMKEDGTTYRMAGDPTSPDVQWCFAATFILPTFANYYAQFTYNATSGAYTYAGDGLETNSPFEGWNMTFKEVSVKFVGGKLAYVSCKRAGYDDGLYEFFVYNYGTTTVTLPTQYVDYQAEPRNEVSSGEWASLVDQLSIFNPNTANVMVRYSYNDGELAADVSAANGVYNFVWYNEDGDVDYCEYYVVQNPEVYEDTETELSGACYNSVAGDYWTNDSQFSIGDIFANIALYSSAFAYEDFEYDSEEKMYKGEDLTVNIYGDDTPIGYAKLSFEDGRITYIEYAIPDDGVYQYEFSYDSVHIEWPEIGAPNA